MLNVRTLVPSQPSRAARASADRETMVSQHAPRCPGYTLVELLIVLVILGILAAVVMPKMGDFRDGAQDVKLSGDLSTIREAIEHYKLTHGGLAPHLDPVAQLTSITDPKGTLKNVPADAPGKAGRTRVPGGGLSTTSPNDTSSTTPFVGPELGPFLRPPFPANPVSKLKSVRIVDSMPPFADGQTGWIYARTTGVLKANSSGTASDGRRYFDL